jgi:predicted AAA+ superfamily ATPase
VARAIRRHLGPVAPEERGPLLEGFVFMLLRFYGERAELFEDIAYWAPTEARTTEVDFILRRGRELLAIEVKSARAVRPADVRGLRAVAELPKIARRILVFLGPRPQRTPEEIEVWPFQQFLQALANDALWP